VVSDKVIGFGLTALSVVAVIAYGYLLFASPYSSVVLKLTVFLAVAVFFSIIAWIGYTLATSPSPKTIKEIERELEALTVAASSGGESQQKQSSSG